MHSVRRCRLDERSELWWWGCYVRELPGYDEGLSPFPADGLQRSVSGSESRLFFNAALLHYGFHGSLSAAAVHMGGGTTDALGGANGIWE